MKKAKLAAFDMDGTVFRSTLWMELAWELIDEGIFSKSAYKKFEKNYHKWLDRQGHFFEFATPFFFDFFNQINGVSEKKVIEISDRLAEKLRNRVYVYPRNLIHRLKSEGYTLIAISGSPKVIVEPFAQKLGFDVSYGIEIEVVEGKYTGKMISKTYEDKSKVIRDYITQSGKEFDLDNSYALGDSDIDIKMLEAVGNPIAFNPNVLLIAEAKKRGWKIVVERKDVIFDVKEFDYIKAEY